ncbi:MAG: tRNA dimethylallyltransferase, partial [FCB group bacterium]|nr:tRNA dimethylallyltransferase [FCB group bacterium]
MAEDKKEVIPIICGPTGSGKTEVAIKLAEILPFEIISADSRQIIKYLNIGTAKPTNEEKQKAKFHLIDMVEPGERYSAFKFAEDAYKAIVAIKNNNKLPLIVGGTGLYLKALTEGVVKIEQNDFSIRKNLEK